jgi:hypothetical protein
MVNLKEKVNYQGQLEIYKLYDDGREELHFKDSNVIVSGLGYGLSLLFSGEGAESIDDYKLMYYQMGVSGTDDLQVSATYGLGSSLPLANYTNVYIPNLVKEQNQLKNDYIFHNQAFGVAKLPIIDGDGSVKFNIILDKMLANNLTNDGKELYLNEIGLFMANPLGNTIRTRNIQYYEGVTSEEAKHTHKYTVDEKGNGEATVECHPEAKTACHKHKIKNWIIQKASSERSPLHIHHISKRTETIETPLLVAYRSFSNIYKSSDFALSFKWTIQIR